MLSVSESADLLGVSGARELDFCEQAAVFDNTSDFSCLAIWLRGALAWWGGPGEGGWLADAMADDEVWRRA